MELFDEINTVQHIPCGSRSPPPPLNPVRRASYSNSAIIHSQSGSEPKNGSLAQSGFLKVAQPNHAIVTLANCQSAFNTTDQSWTQKQANCKTLNTSIVRNSFLGNSRIGAHSATKRPKLVKSTFPQKRVADHQTNGRAFNSMSLGKNTNPTGPAPAKSDQDLALDKDARLSAIVDCCSQTPTTSQSIDQSINLIHQSIASNNTDCMSQSSSITSSPLTASADEIDDFQSFFVSKETPADSNPFIPNRDVRESSRRNTDTDDDGMCIIGGASWDDKNNKTDISGHQQRLVGRDDSNRNSHNYSKLSKTDRNNNNNTKITRNGGIIVNQKTTNTIDNAVNNQNSSVQLTTMNGSAQSITVGVNTNKGTPNQSIVTNQSINSALPMVQIVNGQLVVQAQLQKINTPNGVVTVAVLPSVKQVVTADGQTVLQVSTQMPAQSVACVAPVADAGAPIMTTSKINGSSQISQQQRARVLQPRPTVSRKRSVQTPTSKVVTSTNHQRDEAHPSPMLQLNSVTPLNTKTHPAPARPTLTKTNTVLKLDQQSAQKVQRLTEQILALEQGEPFPEQKAEIKRLELEREQVFKHVLANGQSSPQPSPSHMSSQPSNKPRTRTPSVLSRRKQNMSAYTNNDTPTASPKLVSEFCDSDCTVIDSSLANTPQTTQSVQEPSGLAQSVKLMPNVAGFETMSSADMAQLRCPDQVSAFSSLGDVYARLMPYHHYDEPDYDPQFLTDVDNSLGQSFEELNNRKLGLESQLRGRLMEEAMRPIQPPEQCLIDFLLFKDQERLHQQDIDLAATDLPSFLRGSEFVGRDTLPEAIRQTPSPPSVASPMPSTSSSVASPELGTSNTTLLPNEPSSSAVKYDSTATDCAPTTSEQEQPSEPQDDKESETVENSVVDCTSVESPTCVLRARSRSPMLDTEDNHNRTTETEHVADDQSIHLEAVDEDDVMDSSANQHTASEPTDGATPQATQRKRRRKAASDATKRRKLLLKNRQKQQLEENIERDGFVAKSPAVAELKEPTSVDSVASTSMANTDEEEEANKSPWDELLDSLSAPPKSAADLERLFAKEDEARRAREAQLEKERLARELSRKQLLIEQEKERARLKAEKEKREAEQKLRRDEEEARLKAIKLEQEKQLQAKLKEMEELEEMQRQEEAKRKIEQEELEAAQKKALADAKLKQRLAEEEAEKLRKEQQKALNHKKKLAESSKHKHSKRKRDVTVDDAGRSHDSIPNVPQKPFDFSSHRSTADQKTEKNAEFHQKSATEPAADKKPILLRIARPKPKPTPIQTSQTTSKLTEQAKRTPTKLIKTGTAPKPVEKKLVLQKSVFPSRLPVQNTNLPSISDAERKVQPIITDKVPVNETIVVEKPHKQTSVFSSVLDLIKPAPPRIETCDQRLPTQSINSANVQSTSQSITPSNQSITDNQSISSTDGSTAAPTHEVPKLKMKLKLPPPTEDSGTPSSKKRRKSDGTIKSATKKPSSVTLGGCSLTPTKKLGIKVPKLTIKLQRPTSSSASEPIKSESNISQPADEISPPPALEKQTVGDAERKSDGIKMTLPRVKINLPKSKLNRDQSKQDEKIISKTEKTKPAKRTLSKALIESSDESDEDNQNLASLTKSNSTIRNVQPSSVIKSTSDYCKPSSTTELQKDSAPVIKCKEPTAPQANYIKTDGAAHCDSPNTSSETMKTQQSRPVSSSVNNNRKFTGKIPKFCRTTMVTSSLISQSANAAKKGKF